MRNKKYIEGDRETTRIHPFCRERKEGGKDKGSEGGSKACREKRHRHRQEKAYQDMGKRTSLREIKRRVTDLEKDRERAKQNLVGVHIRATSSDLWSLGNNKG